MWCCVNLFAQHALEWDKQVGRVCMGELASWKGSRWVWALNLTAVGIWSICINVLNPLWEGGISSRALGQLSKAHSFTEILPGKLEEWCNVSLYLLTSGTSKGKSSGLLPSLKCYDHPDVIAMSCLSCVSSFGPPDLCSVQWLGV